jgi:hypothetical protein
VLVHAGAEKRSVAARVFSARALKYSMISASESGPGRRKRLAQAKSFRESI